MKSEIEFSDKQETRGYAHEFVKRLNEAKRKGFKLTGPITERELRSFEQSGYKTPEVSETRSIHERASLAHEEMRDYNLSERARKARLSIETDRAEEAERQRKLAELHIILNPEKKTTTIFLNHGKKN